jgi:hypothetical protein
LYAATYWVLPVVEPPPVVVVVVAALEPEQPPATQIAASEIAIKLKGKLQGFARRGAPEERQSGILIDPTSLEHQMGREQQQESLQPERKLYFRTLQKLGGAGRFIRKKNAPQRGLLRAAHGADSQIKNSATSSPQSPHQ